MAQQQSQPDHTSRNLIVAAIVTIGVISLGGYIQLSDHPFAFLSDTSSTQKASSASLDGAFDPSIPETQRIDMVKNYIVGDWHEPPVVHEAGVVHTNYTFGADGSLRAWQCDRWGEDSERKYKPFDRDGTVHEWHVVAGRYTDDGRIFYQVIRGDGVLWAYPYLMIDRKKGFVTFLPAAKASKPMDKGHSTACD